MGRFTTTTISLLAALLLQVVFGPPLTILGVTPNFLMVAVIIIAFVRGSKEGTIVGFIAGLLFDLVGTTVVGPMALALTLTGFVAGILKEQIFATGWVLPVSVLGIASLASEGIYLVMITALGVPMSFFAALATRALPGALYAMLIAVVCFPIMTKFLGKGTDVEINTMKSLR
ncbi:MAG: rod shape-determining protein MreD [Coriobacteriia bacterium]|nr:rod shape-determining protein MreD [Coriobacteriia bacterium]MCL2537545.1 rod shape-determining protein MreD [Coriobacteriia bacterium]